jgi:hypothetical protein
VSALACLALDEAQVGGGAGRMAAHWFWDYGR